MPERLRAKSGSGENPSEFLPEHLADVFEAAKRILAATGQAQLAAFGNSAHDYERFSNLVLLSAALHDLGKANSHFQGMLLREKHRVGRPQAFRHEWVTLYLLQQLSDWLNTAFNGHEMGYWMLTWIIAGHHPKRGRDFPPAAAFEGCGPDVHVFGAHRDVRAALSFIQKQWNLSEPPAINDQQVELGINGPIIRFLKDWRHQSARQWDRVCRSSESKLVAAAKATLIAADVAGSALPQSCKSAKDRWDWIERSLLHVPSHHDYERVVRNRLQGATPREFQLQVADSKSSITYVKAGCGTGKTLAAYLWAQRNYSHRKLVYCYPTTGTATEGFRGYLFETLRDDDLTHAPSIQDASNSASRPTTARLIHSRAEIDWELILGVEDEVTQSEEEESDELVRIESLNAWDSSIINCTVDTVLGTMANKRRGLYSWPVWSKSAFVFDEIHSYDDSLFNALIEFLQQLPGIPVLLMTASLPIGREEAIRKVFRHRQVDWNPVVGPVELETIPRYYHWSSNRESKTDLVRNEVAVGSKVLWVCNTVNSAIRTADLFGDLNPLVYHSRFRYPDRLRQHRRVVAAFSKTDTSQGTLAICTQVAEMSLDLSADLLVTELAPIPSLIQRLGRLNRHQQPGGQVKPFVVVEPESPLPYEFDEIADARHWIEQLGQGNISQHDLTTRWSHQATQLPARTPCNWIHDGFRTDETELREGSPGISVLMEEDAKSIRSVRDLTRFIIRMPPPPAEFGHKAWKTRLKVPIVPQHAISYDLDRGAKWQNK